MMLALLVLQFLYNLLYLHFLLFLDFVICYLHLSILQVIPFHYHSILYTIHVLDE